MTDDCGFDCQGNSKINSKMGTQNKNKCEILSIVSNTRALRPEIDIKIYKKNIHASISLTEAIKRISALQHNILERKEPLYIKKKGKKKFTLLA